ncbi:MAG: zinc ribbon domain-containing protein [Vicinamibacterales bacterium]
MPLFDFRCQSCAHEFEVLIRPSSHGDPSPSCPACGSDKLERLLSTFALSSREKTQAAAAAKNKKAATIARADTAAMDREIDHHRHEDH